MTDRGGRISVIICAYTEDRWSELAAAVESVRQQTLPAHEIIVVIDHNPPLLARARNQLNEVVVIENRQPRGLSGARNSGGAIASGDIIAFMDEDATAAPDWLAQLIGPYADPDVLGVGGAIEPKWLNGRPNWFPAEFDWVVGCTYRGLPETLRRVRNLIGCNMSLRREVFQQIGGFRSGIGRVGTRPVGCEETELCIRLNQQQPHSVLLYEPRSRVCHRVPKSRSSWRYFSTRCYAEGLSKALVARFVGANDGLSSERTYAFQTLPRGVARGIFDVIQRGDWSGFARAAAITIGLLLTTAGYAMGRAQLGLAGRTADNAPAQINLKEPIS
ncbi:MAG: glycosyltransferase family 2 protein [Chloroflexi bacterium]|nr:glycosyltransferase family 2 protein [Chloroflexota bacterium]